MYDIHIPVSYWTPPLVGTPFGSREQAGVEVQRVGLPGGPNHNGCAAPLRWSSGTDHSVKQSPDSDDLLRLRGVVGAARGLHWVYCGGQGCPGDPQGGTARGSDVENATGCIEHLASPGVKPPSHKKAKPSKTYPPHKTPGNKIQRNLRASGQHSLQNQVQDISKILPSCVAA